MGTSVAPLPDYHTITNTLHTLRLEPFMAQTLQSIPERVGDRVTSSSCHSLALNSSKEVASGANTSLKRLPSPPTRTSHTSITIPFCALWTYTVYTLSIPYLSILARHIGEAVPICEVSTIGAVVSSNLTTIIQPFGRRNTFLR